MKIYLLFCIPFLFCGCSNSSLQQEEDNQPVDLVVLTTYFKGENNDSSSYIGYIHNFDYINNNEIYVELYFTMNQYSQNDYKALVNSGDSIIFQNQEIERVRIPIKNAQEKLDISALKSLYIYDEFNNPVTIAKFKRVEYYNPMISSVFIAVFETEEKILIEDHYGIGNQTVSFRPKKYNSKIDSNLTQLIVDEFNLPKLSHWDKYRGEHFDLEESENTLSVLNGDTCSYIFYKKNNKYSICYQSEWSQEITQINIIPFYRNGMPLLLIKNVQPDTDIEWSSLYAYINGNYSYLERQKIDLKERDGIIE